MRWTYISTLQTKTSLGACRKCLCWLPGLSGSPATSSTPTGQPRRKPAGQMYSASGAVRSAVCHFQLLHSRLKTDLFHESSHHRLRANSFRTTFIDYELSRSGIWISRAKRVCFYSLLSPHGMMRLYSLLFYAGCRRLLSARKDFFVDRGPIVWL